MSNVISIDLFPDSIRGRFWSKVKKGDPDECWMWGGSVNRKGYGSFNTGKIYGTKIAHRFAHLFGHGFLHEDMLVCHSCDTPGCCNPGHLWQGSPRDNSEDMVLKGRVRRGELHWSTNLTEADISAIRALSKTGRFHQSTIAELFGTAQQTISRIVTNKDWRHVV